MTTATPANAPIVELPSRPAPDRGPRRRPGRHLRPVERPTKRRSPAVPVLVGAGIVIVALFALAAMHALLIGGQIQLDDLRREEASAEEELRRLRLRVAELEAPDRVLDAARERLGMVDPGEVGYLLPVGVPGGDDAPVRVPPAEPPPPPPPDETESAEQREVDAAVAGEELPDPDDDPDDASGDDQTADGSSDGPSGDGEPTTTDPSAQTNDAPSEGAPDGSGQ